MISFRNSVTATRLCSSSRAAFKTSLMHHSLGARHLNLGLSDVDLRPGHVSLIAVVKRDRQGRTQRPRIRARNTEICVVLKCVRLIKDIGVGIGVGLGQLEIGLGPTQAVLVGDQVRPVGDGSLDQFFLGNGKRLQPADGVEHVDLVDVVQRQVQDQRERPVRRDLGLASIP